MPIHRHSLWKKVIFAGFGLLGLVTSTTNLSAANSSSPLDNSDIFFDAASSELSQDGKWQNFSGDVVAIASHVILTADHIEINNETKQMRASGHVLFISQNAVYSGENIEYNLDTDDFTLKQAVMVVNDSQKSDALVKQLLGYSSGELNFEIDRQIALEKIKADKLAIKNEARLAYLEKKNLTDKLITKYLRLLESEEAILARPNPYTTLQETTQQKSLRLRRDYWQKSRATSAALPLGSMQNLYFKLSGALIQRRNENDFYAKDALWTPCRCEADESPAWSFSMTEGKAQQEGYLDLSNAIFRIKGIPLLYLPFLKVPLKSSRQSGFILPYFSHDNESGLIYSQPIFFAVADHYDSTLKIDYLQNRGVKIGTEFRLEQSKSSGWTLNLQGIHDRKWISDKAVRSDLASYYQEGLAYAYDATKIAPPIDDLQGTELLRNKLKTRDYWLKNDWGRAEWDQDIGPGTCLQGSTKLLEACQLLFGDLFKTPTNDWRSSIRWKGQSFVAPRLSIASEGEFLSDHRYMQDLYLENETDTPAQANAFDILFFEDDARAFAKSKVQVHLDQRNFYLGLGNSFADIFELSDRYQGQQLPVIAKIQSRQINLLPKSWPVESYVRLGIQQSVITEYKGKNTSISLDPDRPGVIQSLSVDTPDKGTWTLEQVQFITPLVSRSFFTLNHFAYLQQRAAVYGGEAKKNGKVRTIDHGLRFFLPIDGRLMLTEEELYQDESTLSRQQNFFKHYLDFEVVANLRPAVIERGDYPREIKTNGEFAYFAGDVITPSQSLNFRLEQRWGEEKISWRRLTEVDEDDEEENSESEGSDQEDSNTLDKNKASASESKGNTNISEPEKTIAGEVVSSAFNLEKNSSIDTKKKTTRKRKKPKNPPPKTLLQRAQSELSTSFLTPMLWGEELTEKNSKDYYSLGGKSKSQWARWTLDTSFDYLKHQERLKPSPIDEVVKKPFPWTPLTSVIELASLDWVLFNRAVYNIENRFSSAIDFRLATPSFFLTRLLLGYEIDKVRQDTSQLESKFSRTYIRSAGVSSTFIPHLSSTANVKKTINDLNVGTTTVEMKFDYSHPSQCWGLSFKRDEDFTPDGRNPRYLVELHVDFLGKSRKLPDVSPGVVREMPESQQPKQPNG